MTTGLHIKVKDIPDDYTLVQDSQDIQSLYDHGVISADSKNYYGCYFVLIHEGDYVSVYGVNTYVPYLTETAEFLYGLPLVTIP